MASFPATALAIFPRSHLGDWWIGAYWKMTPCLGGLAPVFNVLNSAFSAPRTWSVLEGIFATFSSPPAMEMSLAERTAPRTEVMFGATSPMILSVYFSAASLKLYSSSTVPQTSRSHSRSVPDISAPEDSSADAEIWVALSCGMPNFARASNENDSLEPRL